MHGQTNVLKFLKNCVKFKVKKAKKLTMEAVSSAGDEYVYFFYFFSTPRKCKPIFHNIIIIIIRYQRIKRFMYLI
jgi:hypothetical protein